MKEIPINSLLNSGGISRSLLEIVWQFGPKGLDGECCEDLSMPEFFALEAASVKTDCPVQHIGNKLGFTKSGATRIVNRLEKKGYIQKIRSVEDARICCVVPTEQGKLILARVADYYENRLKGVLAKLPEEQAEKIMDAIHEMAKVLNG